MSAMKYKYKGTCIHLGYQESFLGEVKLSLRQSGISEDKWDGRSIPGSRGSLCKGPEKRTQGNSGVFLYNSKDIFHSLWT